MWYSPLIATDTLSFCFMLYNILFESGNKIFLFFLILKRNSIRSTQGKYHRTPSCGLGYTKQGQVQKELIVLAKTRCKKRRLTKPFTTLHCSRI